MKLTKAATYSGVAPENHTNPIMLNDISHNPVQLSLFPNDGAQREEDRQDRIRSQQLVPYTSNLRHSPMEIVHQETGDTPFATEVKLRFPSKTELAGPPSRTPDRPVNAPDDSMTEAQLQHFDTVAATDRRSNVARMGCFGAFCATLYLLFPCCVCV